MKSGRRGFPSYTPRSDLIRPVSLLSSLSFLLLSGFLRDPLSPFSLLPDSPARQACLASPPPTTPTDPLPQNARHWLPLLHST